MADAAPAKPANLLVFADDWGRHPSSCQHLIRRMLARHRVAWVNTIGTRAPRLNWSTLVRALEKAGQWLRQRRAAEELPSNLSLANPRMWPWFRTPWDRRLNRRLLLRQLTPLVESLEGPTVAVTTLPIVADLMGELAVDRWVYYCVDDFSLWPGLDHAAMAAMEDKVIRRADVVVAVSDNLRSKLRARGVNAHLLTHGVDLDFWRPSPTSSPLPFLRDLPGPLVVFWGLVDRRMDVDWLARLVGDLERGTVVLAGPQSDVDPALLRLPRVVRLGNLPYDELPRLAQAASVLVMPYGDLPVTRAMQPLKLKEYLATGKPAVARDLPANRAWSDALDLAATPEAFSHLVRERLRTGLPTTQAQARTRLHKESWEHKARQFATWALA